MTPRMTDSPFTDPGLIAGSLYATADRLTQRTSALHAAKITGEDATETIADLAARYGPAEPVMCDIGCGRGTTTLRLASRLAPARLIALDRSPALLTVVADRAGRARHPVETVCADYHHLPLLPASIDTAIAAFCLYHALHPEKVIAEIARCLTPTGHAILVTKSADSYHEIDQVIAVSGLDPKATSRPSLYASFHGDVATEITATTLHVEHVLRQRHVFRFSGLDHLAAYLATSPKYKLPEHLTGKAAELATELRHRIPDEPITATSTITYLVAVRL
ncbi:MAG TPA: class I SAM-dependent methyltransferase [Actinophytocola sp.]|uniref:class I SAM-dependent methyltransferase n=1 Tax=Actinophytocola sp. TaxID=1872138 RepID=UPI002DB67C61|nr:class I SAM-dependent methyltransferase [Actinophytocola sp.]HEU5472718.1 class I SAM-dependent methyltransferase [Actinophytocola sp.]